MSERVPDGYHVDHHAPDLFLYRCPDCGHTDKRSHRLGKQSRMCGQCNRLMGCTPVAEDPTAARGEGGQRVMADGGQWSLTDPVDLDQYVPLDMANNITDERVKERIAWVDGLGRAYADALDEPQAMTDGGPHRVHCPECGASNPRGSVVKTCQQCGADLVATDGGQVVGPNDPPAEPEHECDACGAAYHSPDAAAVCCDDLENDPTDLGQYQTPAYVQRQGLGNEFVADYSILDSGWIRVTEWSGDRVKFPPHEIQAIREVAVETYGERTAGGKPRRLADEDEIETARSLASDD